MATVRRRLESFIQYFDEVRREHSNRTRVASQSSHPPEAVAGVERFDQIAFHKTQVAFGLAAPRVSSPDPAGETGRQVGWCAHCGEAK